MQAKLLERMSNDMIRIDNTIMYLEAMDKGEIKQMNRKKLIAKFIEKGYKAIPNDADLGFDHLINLSCAERDIECVPNLVAEREGLHQRMEEMQKTRDTDLWIKDLEELQEKLAEKGMEPQKRSMLPISYPLSFPYCQHTKPTIRLHFSCLFQKLSGHLQAVLVTKGAGSARDQWRREVKAKSVLSNCGELFEKQNCVEVELTMLIYLVLTC